jgi:16S rRNA (guanine527-N7)-methyltransferase
VEEPAEQVTRNPLWDRLAQRASIALSDAQHAQLHRFLDLLIETNERINLTRIVDRADAEVRHVADALSILPWLGTPRTVADVGTGGGVPGVPLAIALPGTRVTLIDSTKKKLDAVMAIVHQLGLTNVEAVHTRIEAHDRKYDVVVARAVAELNVLVDWCDPLLHGKSVLLAMKGPKAQEELDAARPMLQRRKLRAGIDVIDAPELPGHVVVRVERG